MIDAINFHFITLLINHAIVYICLGMYTNLIIVTIYVHVHVHAEYKITIGHWLFSDQNFKMTDQNDF